MVRSVAQIRSSSWLTSRIGTHRSTLFKLIEDTTTRLFLIAQSTGILAVVLHQLDWQFRGLDIIAIIVWLFTVVITIIFSLIYIAKLCLFPATVRRQLTSDIVELCCLASLSITLGAIIDMFALVCAKSWGPSWGTAAYVLSWINVALVFPVVVGIPYVYFYREPPGVERIPPSIALPAISAITASSTCGVVCYAGKLTAREQVPMIMVGYILLSIGLNFAFVTTGIYVVRLLNGGFPQRPQVLLNFILVGPLGQAAYAAQILGMAASSPRNESFGDYNRGTFITKSAGQTISVVSILCGLVLWGYGAFWLLFSLATTVHLGFFTNGGIKTTQYSLSAWSPVFPWV